MEDLDLNLDKLTVKSNIIEIYGEVVAVDAKTRNYKGSSFTVTTRKSKVTKKIECPFFCPIKEGDSIALCTDDDADVLTLKSPPLVYIGMSETTIKNSLIKALYRPNAQHNYKNRQTATEIYDFITRASREFNLLDSTPELVNRRLVELTEDYIYTRDDYYLTQLSDVAPDKTKIIYKRWFKQRLLRQLYLFGLTFGEIRETDTRPSVLFTIIIDNPYLLPSLPLSKCESILKIQGRSPTETQIKCGTILRNIYDLCKNSHWSYVPLSNFEEKFSYILDPGLLKSLTEDYGIIIKGEYVYLKAIYEAQIYIAEQFHKKIVLKSVEEVDSLIDRVNGQSTIPNISEDQKSIIRDIFSVNWSIVTGPAGTGKTTLIKRLAELTVEANEECAIIAFTGKATARAMEIVGEHDNVSIWTIHRFLVQAHESKKLFSHIIIDEMSMVDLIIFYKVLRTIEKMNCKITMVGDEFQLPPINWQSALSSMLRCSQIKHIHLTKIHRTSELATNGIYVNSLKIRNLESGIKKFDNFNMIKGDVDTVVQFVEILLKAGAKLENIVVLCPYGKNNKNRYLQKLNERIRHFVPGDREVTDYIDGTKWKVGDLVMMNKNNYDIGIMNGETGSVTNVSDKSITVTFIKYDLGNKYESVHEFLLNDPSNGFDDDISMDDDSFYGDLTVKYLDHAFAISIHKSQGSEWKTVIIYIPQESLPGEFINQKLLYTSVTRSKSGCIIVGNIECFLLGCLRKPKSPYENLEQFI